MIEFQLNKHAFTIILATVIASVSSTGLILIINEALEDIVIHSIDQYHLYSYGICFIILIAAKRTALRSARQYIEGRILFIRAAIGDLIRKASMQFIDTLEKTDIYVKMSTDARRISRSSEIIIHICHSILTILFCTLYIGHICIYGLIILVSFIVIALIIRHLHVHLLYQDLNAVTNEETDLYESFGDILHGFKEIKINQKKNEDLYDKHLKPRIQTVKNTRSRVAIQMARYQTFLEAIIFLYMAWIIYGMNLDFMSKTKIITIFIFMLPSLYVIDTFLPNMNRTIISIKRINLLFKQLSETKQTFVFQGKITTLKSIQIENLAFSYYDRQGNVSYSIGPINMSFYSGEIVFITGGNGSGKSTFSKVLTGLYPPSKGEFILNNQKVSMTNHRYLFSAIMADYHLFDRFYGVDTVDDSKVNELLFEMKLDTKVKWENNQFSHSPLSTGQQKRLALIIALIEDKPVYVFDEWAADQDSHFKDYFYKHIIVQLKQKGKLVIVITHDDTFFDCADRVVTMDYGRIVGDSLPHCIA
jgi:putative ATP-binding cassette transporter